MKMLAKPATTCRRGRKVAAVDGVRRNSTGRKTVAEDSNEKSHSENDEGSRIQDAEKKDNGSLKRRRVLPFCITPLKKKKVFSSCFYSSYSM